METLGGKAPEYAHAPLLVAPDGRKLSKREGDLNMEALRQKYTPEQLTGKLAKLAGLRQTDAPVTAIELAADFSWDKVRARTFRSRRIFNMRRTMGASRRMRPFCMPLFFRQPLHHGVVRGTLGRVVERLQLQLRIAAMQRRREQVVAKLRIFRQHRPWLYVPKTF